MEDRSVQIKVESIGLKNNVRGKVKNEQREGTNNHEEKNDRKVKHMTLCQYK